MQPSPAERSIQTTGDQPFPLVLAYVTAGKMEFLPKSFPSQSNQQNTASRWFLLQQSQESSCTQIWPEPRFIGWEAKGLNAHCTDERYPSPSSPHPFFILHLCAKWPPAQRTLVNSFFIISIFQGLASGGCLDWRQLLLLASLVVLSQMNQSV